MNPITEQEGTARFERLPVISLGDEVVQVRLTGVTSGSPVTVRARMTNRNGGAWESAAVFTADASGTIDLSTRAPVSGAYAGVEPMGFLWSMRPMSDAPFGSKSSVQPDTIELTAERDGQPIASARHVRLVAAPGVTRTEVRDDGLYGTFFTPAGDGPHPTMLLLSGSGGGLSEAEAALYASRGYAALALAYFRAGHLPETLIRIPLEYFERAIAWLEAQPDVDASRLAVGGTSRGGELCLLLASRYPQFKAVVAKVPSAVVWGGVGGEDGHDQAAWTYRGEDIPFLRSRRGDYLKYATEAGTGIPLTPIFVEALQDWEGVRRATIPVEQINGPVLAISGQDDAMWPSSTFGDMVLERLAEHRHPYPDRHLAYAGTGHGVGQPWWPTTVTDTFHPVSQALFALGGDPKQSAHARADAWEQTLSFLATAFGIAG